MPVFAANIAIFAAGRILLILREDFDVWAMPGGHLDPGESIAAAAVREAREETGLDVRLDRIVGAYSRPLWVDGGFHVLVFAGSPIGGALRAQAEEVADLGWFDPVDLPEPLMLGQRQRITDAVSGASGVARSSPVVFPFESHAQAVVARDTSPLTRREFYVEHILEPNRLGEEADAVEAAGGAQPLSG